MTFMLLILNLIILLYWLKSFMNKPAINDVQKYYKNIKKKGLSYQNLYLFLQAIREGDQKQNKAYDPSLYLKDYIAVEKLEKDEETYFQQLISVLEGKEYNEIKSSSLKVKAKFQIKFFKKLLQNKKYDKKIFS